MTYRNQCRLRRYRRQLRRQRDILASLTPWQRELLDNLLRSGWEGRTIAIGYPRKGGRLHLLDKAKQLHATGYTPCIERRDEV